MTSDTGARQFRLETFRVVNFRTFVDEGLEVDPFATVLVGRNDTGKTSLLQALWLYGQVVANGFRTISAPPELTGSNTPTEFMATWAEVDNGERYLHEIVCDPKRPRESLQVRDQRYTWLPTENRLLTSDRTYHREWTGRHASLGSVGLSDWLADAGVPRQESERLSATQCFRTPRAQLFEPTRLAMGVPPEIGGVQLGGAGWIAMLQEIINRRDGSLEDLESRIGELFPFFRRVSVAEERYEVTRRLIGPDRADQDAFAPKRGDHNQFLDRRAERDPVRGVVFEVLPPHGSGDQSPIWIPAAQVSSGLLLCLAYMLVPLSTPPGSLIALEEPENGLNPTIATNMMESFLDLVRERDQQLIMTTHNPFWLDLVGPSRVRVVVRDEEGSHIRYEPGNFERIRDEGFYLSEIVNLGGPEQLLEERRSG